MIALIMAGGSGTRFWPRSRINQPKQFLQIVGSQTMIQATVERIKDRIGYSNIYLVVGENHIKQLKAQLPQIPMGNIIVEPYCRSTAPCIGLASLYLRKKISENEAMVVLPSDHLIEGKDDFIKSLEAAYQAGLKDYLVTFGIIPDYPETGYGYIHLGEKESIIDGQELYRVRQFIEKPDSRRAEEYVNSGQYLWNSGMFVWKIGVILAQIEKHLPLLYQYLQKISLYLEQNKLKEEIARLYSAIEEISIDHGVMEKASDIYCVKASFKWSDVGSWSALKKLWKTDRQGNAAKGKFIYIDSKNNLIYSPKRLVAAIGVKGLIIVDTDDVLLICDEKRDQEVKEIIKKLKESDHSEYL